MEITAHDHGSFCFAELNTPNAELGKRFYGALLGWGAVDLPINSHHYSLFQLHGRDVAGLRWDARTPHRWVPYVHVESVDRTAARARALGASIVGATSGLPGNVRTCVLEDPEGAVIGLWETRGHQGARLVNEAGTLWWFELLARDIASARSFYTRLFDWAVVETLKYGNGPYTIFQDWRFVGGGCRAVRRRLGSHAALAGLLRRQRLQRDRPARRVAGRRPRVPTGRARDRTPRCAA